MQKCSYDDDATDSISHTHQWCMQRWSVTPSLHTPLMSVTNAISSVIIVGAIIAGLAGSTDNVFTISNILGFLAISLAAINIFGGFLVTQRMLKMYKKKKKDK